MRRYNDFDPLNPPKDSGITETRSVTIYRNEKINIRHVRYQQGRYARSSVSRSITFKIEFKCSTVKSFISEYNAYERRDLGAVKFSFLKNNEKVLFQLVLADPARSTFIKTDPKMKIFHKTPLPDIKNLVTKSAYNDLKYVQVENTSRDVNYEDFFIENERDRSIRSKNKIVQFSAEGVVERVFRKAFFLRFVTEVHFSFFKLKPSVRKLFKSLKYLSSLKLINNQITTATVKLTNLTIRGKSRFSSKYFEAFGLYETYQKVMLNDFTIQLTETEVIFYLQVIRKTNMEMNEQLSIKFSNWGNFNFELYNQC